jgi:hypothetical protein
MTLATFTESPEHQAGQPPIVPQITPTTPGQDPLPPDGPRPPIPDPSPDPLPITDPNPDPAQDPDLIPPITDPTDVPGRIPNDMPGDPTLPGPMVR